VQWFRKVGLAVIVLGLKASTNKCLPVNIHFGFTSLCPSRVSDLTFASVPQRVSALRQGPPLGKEEVDCGAMVMPRQLEIVQVTSPDHRLVI
jgi:hypothetical protein